MRQRASRVEGQALKQSTINTQKSMNSATLTTTSGYTWSTSINGSFDEIAAYFMLKTFDVGAYPEEKLEKVTKVEVFNSMGEPIGTSEV